MSSDITATLPGHLECKADSFHGGLFIVFIIAK